MQAVKLSNAIPTDLTVRALHTSELEPSTVEALKRLFDAAFEGDFSPEDWEHARGGLHLLAERDGDVIGHVALVQRSLVCDRRPLRVGYVEGFAVHPRHQRRGVGSALMARLEQALLRSFEMGALSATESSASLYAQRGWLLWRGPLFAFGPEGVVSTPEESGGIFVFPVGPAPDLELPLICDSRSGDVW